MADNYGVSIGELAELTGALQPARRLWVQAATQALESFDLSMPLASAIILVSRHQDGMRQNELGDEIGVNPGAIVRTLDQAEEAGLLERRGVPGDRRANNVHILPKGAELAAQMEMALSQLRVELFDDIPLAHLRTATRVLRLIEERSLGVIRARENV